MVWARRLQDRVNERATSENWCARLDVQGFQWDAEVSQTQRDCTAVRIDHTLRWLMRRFVNDPWLEARLGPPPSDRGDDLSRATSAGTQNLPAF